MKLKDKEVVLKKRRKTNYKLGGDELSADTY